MPSPGIDELKAIRGVYLLVLELTEESIVNAGKLGTKAFPSGFYMYIGSAQGKTSTSLGWRLARYLTISKRKRRWHIDHLLTDGHAKIIRIVFARTSEGKECTLSRAVSQKEWIETPLKGFGATDCVAGCPAHLYRSRIPDIQVFGKRIHDVFEENELTPEDLDPESLR